MREQLLALAAAADRWIVQVVPLESGTYVRLDGPFVIATVDHREVVYTPAQLRDYIHDGADAVAEAAWRWDTIRSDALPRDLSRDFIVKVAESYE
jgi:hypothetical protein